MNAPFRLYGAELSPYSIKLRAYLSFKGLEFAWLARSNARQEEFQRYATLPLVPVLVDADDRAMQDTTPIMEQLEARYAEPSAVPQEPALAFLAALIEDYADEWLNKAMFHYRWTYPEDQQSAAQRIVEMIYEGAEAPEGVEEAVRNRMVGRLYHVGSAPETAALIEGSFTHLLRLLERLLGSRSYLFGGRPSFADFGLAGQLSQLRSDPTPGALMKAHAPNVVRWLDRMERAEAEGEFEPLESLRADLVDLLRDEVAGAYLAWAAANAEAVREDAPGVSVEIGGETFTQKPQRYAAKAFAELRRKRALLSDDAALAALLGETGCDAYLEPPADALEGASDEDSGEEADVDEAGDDDAEM